MLIKRYLQGIAVKTSNQQTNNEEQAIFIHVENSKQCGQVLVAEIYEKGQLNFRFFTDGKSWTGLDKDQKWSRRKPCGEYRSYSEPEEDTRKVILDFFGDSLPEYYKNNQYITASQMLNEFVTDKVNDRRRKAAENQKIKMENHINLFPQMLTPEIKQYIEDVVLLNKYIIMKKRSNNKTEEYAYQCLSCGRTFYQNDKKKHKSSCTCPTCKRVGVVIAERYLSVARDQEKMLIFYKKDNVILKHYIKVKRRYFQDTFQSDIDYETDCYEVIEDGKVYGYKWQPMYWVGWCKTKQRDLEARFIYADNLNQIYPDGKLLGLNLMRLRNAGAIHFDDLIDAVQRTKTSSQLYKIGLFKLAAQAASLPQDVSFEAVTGISSNYKPLVRKYNVSYKELCVMKMADCHIGEEMFVKLRELVSEKDRIDLTDKVRSVLEKMTYTKMINYFFRQKNESGAHVLFSTMLTWYKDYLNMTDELNQLLPDKQRIDVSDMYVRFPINLKKAHDNIALQLTCENNIEKTKQLKQIKEDIENEYRLSYMGLVLVIPESIADFVHEGSTLHHCIANGTEYINAHIKGTHRSFFIRKKGAIDKPYYTFTLRMETEQITLTECHGRYHKSPTEQITEFIRLFIQKIESQRLKEKTEVA